MGLPRKGIDHDVLLWEIRALKADVAPGLGCLHNEHLLTLAVNQSCQIMPSAAAAIDNYLNYANVVIQLQMPDYFYAAWVSSHLVPANKLHPDDLPPETTLYCCHVIIGIPERRLITRAFFILQQGPESHFQQDCWPSSTWSWKTGGNLNTAFGVTLALDKALEFGVIQGDLKNGYNEVSCESIMRALQEAEKLGDILMFSHALLCHSSCVGMGSGMRLTNASFRIDEGIQQGAVEIR
jgi:hypothetical protein